MSPRRYYEIITGREFWGYEDCGFVRELCGPLHDKTTVARGIPKWNPEPVEDNKRAWTPRYAHPVYSLEVNEWTYPLGSHIGDLLALAKKLHPDHAYELRKEKSGFRCRPKTQIWRVA